MILGDPNTMIEDFRIQDLDDGVDELIPGPFNAISADGVPII